LKLIVVVISYRMNEKALEQEIQAKSANVAAA